MVNTFWAESDRFKISVKEQDNLSLICLPHPVPTCGSHIPAYCSLSRLEGVWGTQPSHAGEFEGKPLKARLQPTLSSFLNPFPFKVSPASVRTAWFKIIRAAEPWGLPPNPLPKVFLGRALINIESDYGLFETRYARLLSVFRNLRLV